MVHRGVNKVIQCPAQRQNWQQKNKKTQVSVIIFYSHMLHFALNVQVILSGQTQKV